ncbi:hypothetical protein ACS5PN_12825 [Roseateles sp. NT4]|uniref:hypothetical protein n=1 Tax=Roseateles sp. NT4 TaxID=3453715 RepID=UPI003EEB1085
MSRSAAALLLSASLGAWAAPSPLPKEVQTLVDQREACDHYRGQRGFDAERQKDIDWSVCQSCPGTDAELARLKQKYKGNAHVTQALAGLEPRVEPDDKAAQAKFCQATRKPAGVR